MHTTSPIFVDCCICVAKRQMFLLFQLTVEGGTAVAVFARCFADSKGIEHELIKLYTAKFPRGLLAALSVCFFPLLRQK